MKYAISLVGLFAAVGHGAVPDKCPENNCVRAVIASAYPLRPTESDCKSFLSVTATPVITQTSWHKTSTSVVVAAVTSTVTLTLGQPTPALDPTQQEISYPPVNYVVVAPGGRRVRRTVENVKRDDPYPAVPSPIPDGWYPESPSPTTDFQTATSLPAYAVTACREITEYGTVRSPESRFSHACLCRTFTPATTTTTVKTVQEEYTITTAITTITPISWVFATKFRVQFTGAAGASFSGQFVATSSIVNTETSSILRPSAATALAATFTLHPDRKPNFATPPNALVAGASDPTDPDMRRISIGNHLLVAKSSTDAGNQRFLRLLNNEYADGDTIPSGHFPLLCKIDENSIFSCQATGSGAPVVSFGMKSAAEPLLRLYASDFNYDGITPSGVSVAKGHFQLKAVN
ncbi:hypothetical protein TWF718_000384 [Orbilia javanica]|uniref:Uncharacterized protein n=1 Tax=Orbilia javanica TaxID=47235 RepID=A0AAN8RRL1_9PEZI